jgi:hypothetical protein
MISGLDVSSHLGGFVGMQTHLITVILPDEIGIGLNAQYFALDGVVAIQVQTNAQHAPTRDDSDHFGNRDHGCLLD